MAGQSFCEPLAFWDYSLRVEDRASMGIRTEIVFLGTIPTTTMLQIDNEETREMERVVSGLFVGALTGHAGILPQHCRQAERFQVAFQ